MEKISIKVKDKVAEAWGNASEDLKNEISELIENQISQLLSNTTDRKQVLEYLQSLQKDMSQKGLTQDILDEILK